VRFSHKAWALTIERQSVLLFLFCHAKNKLVILRSDFAIESWQATKDLNHVVLTQK